MRGIALCNGGEGGRRTRQSNKSRDARIGGMGKGNRRGISTLLAIKHVLFCTRRVWSNDTICLFCWATMYKTRCNPTDERDARSKPGLQMAIED